MPDAPNNPMDFIAQLEDIEITPAMPARVIINERTGTIVATANVKISSCAVACGNITINIASSQDVSQPNPFQPEWHRPTVTSHTTTDVTENKASLVTAPGIAHRGKGGGSLERARGDAAGHDGDFPGMKQAGALQAELLIR
jgi:flagellar P-ring protein FlgI